MLRKAINLVLRARAVLLLVIACSVYSCSTQDNFECGLRKSDGVATCNGPGEFCVCGSHRCAKPDAECTQSLHAYVFEDGDDNGDPCVPKEQLVNVTFANAQDQDNALCPDQLVVPPRCGEPVAGQATVCPGVSVC